MKKLSLILASFLITGCSPAVKQQKNDKPTTKFIIVIPEESQKIIPSSKPTSKPATMATSKPARKKFAQKCFRDSECQNGLRCSNFVNNQAGTCSFDYLSRKKNESCRITADCESNYFCLNRKCQETDLRRYECLFLKLTVNFHENYVRFNLTRFLLSSSVKTKAEAKKSLLYYLKIGQKILWKWRYICSAYKNDVEAEWYKALLLKILVVDKGYDRPI